MLGQDKTTADAVRMSKCYRQNANIRKIFNFSISITLLPKIFELSVIFSRVLNLKRRNSRNSTKFSKFLLSSSICTWSRAWERETEFLIQLLVEKMNFIYLSIYFLYSVCLFLPNAVVDFPYKYKLNGSTQVPLPPAGSLHLCSVQMIDWILLNKTEMLFRIC